MCLKIPPYDYYVYTLSHPIWRDENNRGWGGYSDVFYVGKGVGIRIYVHEEDARRGCKCKKCDYIRSLWRRQYTVVKKLIFTTPDEDAAYRRERELIDKIGIHNLLNVHRTPGEARYLNLPQR